MELNALTEEPANKIAQTENFMFVLLSIFEIKDFCRRDVVLDTGLKKIAGVRFAMIVVPPLPLVIDGNSFVPVVTGKS